MRYAAIRKFDVTNGPGNGVSLFVQGCHFHCYQCFNPETWDFNGGKEWNEQTEKKFLKLIGRNYIRRVSFLGGEPLCPENRNEITKLIIKIRKLYPDKKIWVYTGYIFEKLLVDKDSFLQYVDILVDGQFIYDKRDFNLKFRGSSNQRIIDVQKTLKSGEIILWQYPEK